MISKIEFLSLVLEVIKNFDTPFYFLRYSNKPLWFMALI